MAFATSTPCSAATVARSAGTLALGLAGDGQHGVDQRLAVGRLAEDVETAADLGVLEGAEVAVDVADHGAEVVGVGHLVDAEVAGQLAGDEQVPDLAPDRRQLAGVERLDLRVRVEQALEAGGVVVAVGPGHRRREVVDDHGVGAALGLGALAGVVDDERVQQRQVAERGIGDAGRRRPDALARHPLQRPVLAEVDDGVGAVAVLQPAVEREVVVGRRQVGVVIGADRVGAEPAGRLDGDHGVAEVEPGEHEVPVVHRHVAGRRTPRLLHLVPQVGGQGGEPGDVLLDRHPPDRQRLLRIGQPRLVVGQPVGQRGDDRVGDRRPPRRRRGPTREAGGRLDAVAGVAQRTRARGRGWRACRGRRRCRCGCARSDRRTGRARPACRRRRRDGAGPGGWPCRPGARPGRARPGGRRG